MARRAVARLKWTFATCSSGSRAARTARASRRSRARWTARRCARPRTPSTSAPTAPATTPATTATAATTATSLHCDLRVARFFLAYLKRCRFTRRRLTRRRVHLFQPTTSRVVTRGFVPHPLLLCARAHWGPTRLLPALET